ncbi:uncharacterized protein LOC120708666 isoform X3 [Panicum virgatum]|uniref:uncharacterized protein LOC120708666 isoform X3 n=1 Tax=Panicum virgatum TaxID=38727 RepID=UPI0019D518EE|nr:uncharacterized protein LOC120708666 isoform X3 [Panicum virgatum]
MDSAEVPEGKEYNRGRTISYAVDSEEYSIIDLEKDVAEEFKWGSDQQTNFWVLIGGHVTSKLASDAQFLGLLRASRVVKLLMIVGRQEHNVREEEMPTAVNMGEEDMPVAMNMEEEVMPETKDNAFDALDEGFLWAEIPEYEETTGGPPVAEEEEKEHFIIGGCDPNGDEPAGVDEEWRYFKTLNHVVINPAENHEVEVQNRKRPRSVPEISDYDTEVVHDDEATVLDDFIVPHTSHYTENPGIKEGDTFVDKNDFVQTIKQYAIKNEFETRLEQYAIKDERLPYLGYLKR